MKIAMSVSGHFFFFFCGDAMFVIFFLRCHGVAGGCRQCPNVESSSDICITGFTQLKYSSLLQVKFTIFSIHKWFDFMNKTRQSGAQTFPFSRFYEYSKNARSELFESSRARLTRQLRLGSKKKPIWRLTCQQNTCVEKLDPK